MACSGSRPGSGGSLSPGAHIGCTCGWCSVGPLWRRPRPPTQPCSARSRAAGRRTRSAAACVAAGVPSCGRVGRSRPRRPRQRRAPRTGPGAWKAHGRSLGGNVPGGQRPCAGDAWPTVSLSPEERGANRRNGPRLRASGAGLVVEFDAVEARHLPPDRTDALEGRGVLCDGLTQRDRGRRIGAPPQPQRKVQAHMLPPIRRLPKGGEARLCHA